MKSIMLRISFSWSQTNLFGAIYKRIFSKNWNYIFMSVIFLFQCENSVCVSNILILTYRLSSRTIIILSAWGYFIAAKDKNLLSFYIDPIDERIREKFVGPDKFCDECSTVTRSSLMGPWRMPVPSPLSSPYVLNYFGARYTLGSERGKGVGKRDGARGLQLDSGIAGDNELVNFRSSTNTISICF